jgi:putative DNA primase/helicase
MDDNAVNAVDVKPGEPFTEYGFARRMVALHGHGIRFVGPWQKWIVWDGRKWERDTTGQVARHAKNTARRMLNFAVQLPADDPGKKAHVAAAMKAETARGIGAIVTLASTQNEVAINPDELDADPFLLNCQNGTLDLRTGELSPHDPARLITMITGAAYHPERKGDAFSKFLERIQPDPDMREFLARLLGHTISGDVTEHIMPIFHGTGANGKSTLVDAVLATVGDYGKTVDPHLLVDGGSAHPTGVADLFGCRLAITHETDSGQRLAEGTLKRLTGDGMITARRMREDFWDFAPTHSIVMLTNHRPQVRGTDDGIWRRLRLIPFDVQIPPAEQDHHLRHTLDAERDAVLAWLVRGYFEFKAKGLHQPATVTTATDEYRESEDVFSRWALDCCVVGADRRATSAELWSSWNTWTFREHVGDAERGTRTAFGRELERRGYHKIKSGTVSWHGIGLSTDSDG